MFGREKAARRAFSIATLYRKMVTSISIIFWKNDKMSLHALLYVHKELWAVVQSVLVLGTNQHISNLYSTPLVQGGAAILLAIYAESWEPILQYWAGKKQILHRKKAGCFDVFKAGGKEIVLS